MLWPEAAVVESGLRLPPGIRARSLAREDVPAVIESLGAWYPSLAMAEEHSLLDGTFYETRVALAREQRDAAMRPVHVLLLEAEVAPVGYLAIEYDAHSRTMLGRLSVVDPRFRGLGLGGALVQASVDVTRAMGIASIFGLVELDNRAQCASLDRAGHLLCGITPDSDRKPVGPSTIRYVPEAVYVNLLVPPDELVWPDAEALRPATAALMKLLFDHGEPPESSASPVTMPRPRLGEAAAARCRARPEGTWPDIRWLAEDLHLPPGVTARTLARADVPALIGMLAALDPRLDEAPDPRLLDPSFYEQHVALAGEDASIERRPVHAWVVEREGRIEALHHATHDPERSTLTGRLSTPASRRTGAELQALLPRWLSLVGPLLDVETLLCWVDLRERSGQLACERSGLRLLGFYPASDRITVAPGVVRHGFHAIYGASQVSPERSHVPARSAMSPRVAALADFVLGRAPA
ncbi:GNAT family N-acetyltransferase [Paraliomyxa miuraensis]|uniref:GNAT family N-acetyltransferase n=1 Tax=Paraliomyxa miuraensis TaxID=376150 RepID=UPI0022509C0C|nr:GNAT family N-acetyltransferase [Paraliomyxa miuraensis]MCX4240046.1 GNAT family N-acetyltransferase [Paraliomyxa miuraensis]